MNNPDTPSRDDAVTTMRCPACDQPLHQRQGRQRYCSPACRQAAYRRRHAAMPSPPPAAGSRRSTGIYQCDDCEQRYHGHQWCEDCQRPCRRIGTGGSCPECDSPITMDELLAGLPS